MKRKKGDAREPLILNALQYEMLLAACKDRPMLYEASLRSTPARPPPPAGTTWLAEGKSPALIQKAMGHSDLATTMGYAHLLDRDLLALVEDDDESIRALAEG